MRVCKDCCFLLFLNGDEAGVDISGPFSAMDVGGGLRRTTVYENIMVVVIRICEGNQRGERNKEEEVLKRECRNNLHDDVSFVSKLQK